MTRLPAVGGADGAAEIAQKDAAETFSESDLNLSLTKAAVDSGCVKLSGTSGDVISTATLNPQASVETYSNEAGVVINPNQDLSGVRFDITVSGESGARLEDSDGNILSEVSGSPPYTLEADMLAGQSYRIFAFDDVSRISFDYDNGGTAQSSALDITGGWIDGSSLYAAANYVEALGDTKQGNATVEWPEPPDVYRWDAATFQTSSDGETVEVYVEEDDGSGWTEIAGPISRGDQIDADPASRVRFRVELSRTDTSNNPTLDAIYRRWVV